MPPKGQGRSYSAQYLFGFLTEHYNDRNIYKFYRLAWKNYFNYRLQTRKSVLV